MAARRALPVGEALADVGRVVFPERAKPGAEGLGDRASLRPSIKVDEGAGSEGRDYSESVGGRKGSATDSG